MKMPEVVESNLDIAKRVLKAFRGYNFRQNFIEPDLAVLVSLLDQWDGQVGLLEEKLSEYMATNLRLNAVIEELEETITSLKATQGLKGVMRWAIGSKSESQSTVTAP